MTLSRKRPFAGQANHQTDGSFPGSAKDVLCVLPLKVVGRTNYTMPPSTRQNIFTARFSTSRMLRLMKRFRRWRETSKPMEEADGAPFTGSGLRGL